MSLTFEEATHTYRLDGRQVPSVTQLIDKLGMFAGVSEEVLAAARERGTRVHKACWYSDENDLDEGKLTPGTMGYLAAWQKFRAEIRCEIVEVEKQRAHPRMRYAGTCDRVLRIDSVEWIADIKTGPAHWPMGLQTAAYSHLRTGNEKRATVHLRADGTYRFKEWSDPDDLPAFLSLVTLHNKALRHA